MERLPRWYPIVLCTIAGFAFLLLWLVAPSEEPPKAEPPKADEKWVEYTPKFPPHLFKSGPIGFPEGAIVVKEVNPKEMLQFFAPEGTWNVAQGCPVIPSSASPTENLALITDGNTSPDGAKPWVTLGSGLEWIQLDLGKRYRLWRFFVFRDHLTLSVMYSDVIVQVSDDPEFKRGVQTIFNNDFYNSAGLGLGKDPMYLEGNHHPPMKGDGKVARFVRIWSRPAPGSYSQVNGYNEVMVYGSPP